MRARRYGYRDDLGHEGKGRVRCTGTLLAADFLKAFRNSNKFYKRFVTCFKLFKTVNHFRGGSLPGVVRKTNREARHASERTSAMFYLLRFTGALPLAHGMCSDRNYLDIS